MFLHRHDCVLLTALLALLSTFLLVLHLFNFLAMSSNLDEAVLAMDPFSGVNLKGSESRARQLFVQKVYSILVISVTITLANGLLSMVFMSRYVVAGYGGDLLGCIVYLSIGLTFFFWCSVTYISLRTELDFTVHKLFLWSLELVWLFIFVGIWMFSGYRQFLVLWATLGLIIVMMMLSVDAQMVAGGLKHEFSVQQYLIAPLSLYWDVMLLFLLTLPVMAAIINTFILLINSWKD